MTKRRFFSICSHSFLFEKIQTAWLTLRYNQCLKTDETTHEITVLCSFRLLERTLVSSI